MKLRLPVLLRQSVLSCLAAACSTVFSCDFSSASEEAGIQIVDDSSERLKEALTITKRLTGTVDYQYYDGVTFTGIYSYIYSGINGGAINCGSNKSIILSHNGSVEFSRNTAEAPGGNAYGGAIYVDSSSTLTMNDNGSVIFSMNKASSMGSLREVNGGAICANGTISINHNTNVKFFENAGAITSYKDVTLCHNGSVAFSKNKYALRVIGTSANPEVTLCHNDSVSVEDDMIFIQSGTLTLNHNGCVVFNMSQGADRGASIYVSGAGVYLNDNKRVSFGGNVQDSTYTDYSGAISTSGNLSIRNNGEVEFYGNAEKSGSTYQLRSINAGGFGKLVSLSAAKDKSITFRDSIYIASGSTVELNAAYTTEKGEELQQGGDIVFSGASIEDDLYKAKGNKAGTEGEILNSLTTEVNAMTNLYGGRLRVEDGAIYQGYGITAHEGSEATVLVKDATLNHSGYDLIFNAGTTLELAGANTITGNVQMLADSILHIDFSGNENATQLQSLSLGEDTNLLLTVASGGDGKTYTLLSGLSNVQDKNGNTLTAGSYSINDYFDETAPGSGFWADATLVYTADGMLQIMRHNETVKDALEITEHQTADQDYSYFKSISFNDISSSSFSGGAIDGGTITLSNNGSVTFSGNSTSRDSDFGLSHGGAICGATITLSNNGSVSFNRNSSEHGGAIDGDGKDSTITLDNNGSVTFDKNSARIGGAIDGERSTVTLSNNGSVTFSGNSASEEGGAIYVDWGSSITLSGNGSVEFNKNSAGISGGGAICGHRGGLISLSDNGIVIFSGNGCDSFCRYGGAIHGGSSGTITLSNNGSVEFRGNMAAYGGAIYAYGNLSIRNNDSVFFEKNAEKSAGDYRLRSIYAGGSDNIISLSAAEGKSIEFRDAIFIDSGCMVNLNADYTDAAGAVHKQTGDIIFSGKNTEQHLNELLAADRLLRTATEEEILNSRTTEVNTMTNLYGGRLRVEDGAIYKGAGITTHADTGASVWLRSAQMQHAGYNVNIARGTGVGVCGINFCSANLILADGCYLSFDIGGENMTSAVLTHIGNLTLGSTITLNIGTSDAELQKGSYQLMRVEDSTAISGWGEVNFVIKSGEFTLSDLSWVENTLCFNYTGQKLSDLPDFTSPGIPECPEPDNPSPDIPPADGRSLTWANAKKAVWQDGAAGWVEGGVFSAGDEVTFTDGNVTIVDEVAPGEVTICTNKSLAFKTNYDKKTQQYSGAIAGETSVTIDAAPKAKVTMNDGNTYSGGTIIEGGSVKAGGATSFGTGTITLNGGTLDLAGKAVDNAIALEGAAIIKGGAKYTGDFSMGSGADLMKGSVVNVAEGKTVTLGGGAINGTLSGLGSIEVAGDVELGATGKLTTGALAVESGTFSIGSKGLALSARNSILTVNGGVVDSEGKLSTNELQMTGGEISIDTAKAMSLDIKGKTTSRLVDNGRIRVAGKMSVAGNLELAGAASIHLYDPSGNNKAMPLAVKGSLTLGSGSTLTLSGALSARDMVLDGGTINLTSNKPLTIKVGNRLDINGPVDLNLGFTVADKDVNKKSFKILTFKSSNLGDAGELYDLLGLSDSYCTLSFDKKKTSVMLTVTDKEAWDAYIADEEAEAPTATTALVNPVLPDYSGVADALVQANWGLVESSRAFVNAIGNRSMAVQLGSGERAVWASAIAGSSRRSSSGTHGGADTNITGGAIGMETQLGESSLLGMALGNSWTRVSAHNYGTIKQDTTHLGIYGQTNWNKLSADWSAAYGRSESKVNGSDWSQRAIQLDGRLSYNHALSETVLLRGFGGVQYYASDSARVDGIDSGEVQNLRGEIGVGIVRSTYKSSVYAELALHQDLVRDNPEVRSPFGQRYHGTNPGRTGINLTIGGSYALSDQWSVNASYTAEVVENANAHSVNVGATYKF